MSTTDRPFDYVELQDFKPTNKTSFSSSEGFGHRESKSASEESSPIGITLGVRVATIILCACLLCLSIFYALSEVYETRLSLITKCEPKTREEIWAHSFESAIDNDGTMQLTKEGQFGFTDEACWTTKNLQINTDHLWKYNKYEVNTKSDVSSIFVLFTLIAAYCLVVIIISLYSLLIDVIALCRGNLYLKSSLYANHHLTKISEESTANSYSSKVCHEAFSRSLSNRAFRVNLYRDIKPVLPRICSKQI